MGDEEGLNLLLNFGVDVDRTNTDGNTALMLAALHGQEQTVKKLLARGADLRKRNNNGQKALALAWSESRWGIIRMLRNLGDQMDDPVMQYRLETGVEYVEAQAEAMAEAQSEAGVHSSYSSVLKSVGTSTPGESQTDVSEGTAEQMYEPDDPQTSSGFHTMTPSSATDSGSNSTEQRGRRGGEDTNDEHHEAPTDSATPAEPDASEGSEVSSQPATSVSASSSSEYLPSIQLRGRVRNGLQCDHSLDPWMFLGSRHTK